MKKATLSLLLLLACALTAYATVPTPTPGVYHSSPDPASSFPEGRGSQSNELPGDGANGVGDVFNSQSWDGANLGDQWRFSCGIAPAAHGVVNNVDASGTGTITYTNTFVGGTFFLSKDGPWGDGVNDWTGTLNTTSSTVLVQLVNWQFMGSVGNVSTSGQFDVAGCYLTFEINNLVGLGDTDLTPPFPANYPALLDPSCDPTRVNGSWGDVVDLILRIDCAVQNEQSTWGGVKAIYR
jgi:hypothetical protein